MVDNPLPSCSIWQYPALIAVLFIKNALSLFSEEILFLRSTENRDAEDVGEVKDALGLRSGATIVEISYPCSLQTSADKAEPDRKYSRTLFSGREDI